MTLLQEVISNSHSATAAYNTITYYNLGNWIILKDHFSDTLPNILVESDH